MSSVDAMIVMIAYSFQIYFDFSGYGDMVVGMASMLYIEILCNFNAPYQADLIIEFWKRWYIVLANFLTKYAYYPLGENVRKIELTREKQRLLWEEVKKEKQGNI